MNSDVYITGIETFLPNRAIGNDEMEEYLGRIDNVPSRARRVVLRNNGIRTRYYALEKGGVPTHNNAEIAEKSISKLFDASFKRQDLELLACGTASPDQLVPSHAAMVHGLLNLRPIEIASFAGSCCASIQALKLCFLSISSGNSRNAICSGSEMLSHWMLAKYFQRETDCERRLNANPILGFEKDFLRWMLSDGSGAIRLEDKPNCAVPLKIEWIDIRSYANEAESCMYVAADKNNEGRLSGYSRFDPEEWLTKSIFSAKQDTRILDKFIVQLGVRRLKELETERRLCIDKIDFFLPHLSSELFRKRIHKQLAEAGIGIPQDKWFTNLDRVGNVATASFILMLDELRRFTDLQRGQTILVAVPESARFTYGYMLLTVC
jgi:3-oxoacyl-[acyl-carrier-protein] synthase-3